jgi:site-specific DNA-methyltransferase (adenine-specific)
MTHFAFNADCMEIMSRYPDKWFDLAVVDPPYGIGEADGRCRTRKKHNNIVKHKRKNWDNSAPDKKYFNQLFRVSKNQIIWGANYFTHFLPPSMGWVFWDKRIGGDFSDGELAFTSFNRALKMYTKWAGNNGVARIHPTQKPIALYDWIFKNYLPNGGRVLDTHGGSMSSLISAIKAGNIEMTISELDSDYYQAAQKRVNDFMSQLNLFQERPEIIW